MHLFKRIVVCICEINQIHLTLHSHGNSSARFMLFLMLYTAFRILCIFVFKNLCESSHVFVFREKESDRRRRRATTHTTDLRYHGWLSLSLSMCSFHSIRRLRFKPMDHVSNEFLGAGCYRRGSCSGALFSEDCTAEHVFVSNIKTPLFTQLRDAESIAVS